MGSARVKADHLRHSRFVALRQNKKVQEVGRGRMTLRKPERTACADVPPLVPSMDAALVWLNIGRLRVNGLLIRFAAE
jgi:hypothetical protein